MNDLPKSLIALCASSILVALGAAIVFIFMHTHAANYQIFCVIGLIGFALSSISGLLFAVKSAEITGKAGPFHVSFVGPAAVWLIAIVVCSYSFHSEFGPDILTSADQVRHDHEVDQQNDGWIHYDDFKNSLDILRPDFEYGEESEISRWLSSGYYGGSNHPKPEHCKVRQLWLYVNNAAVGFNFVTGSRHSPNSPQIELYRKVIPSNPGSESDSACFYKDGDTVYGASSKSSANWISIPSESLDYISVTYFKEPLTSGDWNTVDTPRYIDSSSMDGISLSVTVLADKQIDASRSKFFSVRTDQYSDASEVPLRFHYLPLSATNNVSAADLQTLRPWMSWLDSVVDAKTDPTGSITPRDWAVLSQAKRLLGGGSKVFCRIIDDQKFQGISYSATGLRDSMIAIFFTK